MSRRAGLALAAALSTAPAAAAQADAEAHDAVLRTRLAALADAQHVPALGGAIVTRDGLLGAWVTGVRAQGRQEAASVDDRWHLGSCTKAMTATLIALLVEHGDLAWDTALPQLLPDLGAPIDPGYANVTLVDLLAHRAGLPPMTAADPDLAACRGFAGTASEQRRELCRRLLTRPPPRPPRGAFEYSNAGLIVAGRAAEVATGRSWEDLMRSRLFAPLGMTTAGFGAPGSATAHDQPCGHRADGSPVVPGPDADNPPLLGPAGTVHASLADWARFLQLHLRGVLGDLRVGDLLLPRAATARLHTPWEGDGERYGYGWLVAQRPWAAGDHTVITHAGSNTLWYCATWLDPAGGFGVLAVTNSGAAGASRACDQASSLLIQEWQRRRDTAPAADAPAPQPTAPPPRKG